LCSKIDYQERVDKNCKIPKQVVVAVGTLMDEEEEETVCIVMVLQQSDDVVT
jgi:hypothetical protein